MTWNEEVQTATVELEMWMWKQIIGCIRHSKHNSYTKESKMESEHIEKAIEYQLEREQ